MARGRILGIVELGKTWQLLYEKDGDGLGIIDFDLQPFAELYGGATGRSFYADYNFGIGVEYIAKRLKGKRIFVRGERPSQIVRVERN